MSWLIGLHGRRNSNATKKLWISVIPSVVGKLWCWVSPITWDDRCRFNSRSVTQNGSANRPDSQIDSLCMLIWEIGAAINTNGFRLRYTGYWKHALKSKQPIPKFSQAICAALLQPFVPNFRESLLYWMCIAGTRHCGLQKKRDWFDANAGNPAWLILQIRIRIARQSNLDTTAIVMQWIQAVLRFASTACSFLPFFILTYKCYGVPTPIRSKRK